MRIRWRASLVVLAVALLLASLETTGRVLYRTLDGREHSWWAGARGVFPVWITFALVVPFCAWMARRFPIDSRNWPYRIPIHVLGGFVFCMLHLVLDVLAQSLLNGPPTWSFPRQVAWLFGYYVAVETFIYWGVTGTFMLVRHERLVHERRLAHAEMERLLRERQLELLRVRLQPHFVFNTLNAIATLGLRGEGQRVAGAIGKFGELLRHVLDEVPDSIPLAREMELVESYLEIQRLRFPDRLRVERRIDPDTLQAEVPSFILQPLVENAVEHGISGVEGGTIVIASARRNGSLELDVRDNGPGFDSALPGRDGMGLANTRARLQLIYGDDQALECITPPDGGAIVRVRLPFHRQAPERSEA